MPFILINAPATFPRYINTTLRPYISKKFTNSRLNHWNLSLSEYKYKVQYHTGKENGNAYTFSQISGLDSSLFVVTTFNQHSLQTHCTHCSTSPLLQRILHTTAINNKFQT